MKNILMVGTLLLIFFSVFARKKPETGYAWQVSEGNKFEGDCYEVDKETWGKAYSSKASKKKCRPEQTAFYWLESHEFGKGKCYEVDMETGGKRYSNQVKGIKCRPENAVFLLTPYRSSFRCYLVDEETGGKSYAVETNIKDCRPSKTVPVWYPNESGMGGKCYLMDETQENLQFKEKTDSKDCRPAIVKYKWIQGESSGDCWEYDAKLGTKGYSKKVDRQFCLTEESYVWVSDYNNLKGKCMKVGLTNQSKKYYLKVSPKKCKPLKTVFTWIKTKHLKGECLEVDSETMGDGYFVKVNKNNCRPLETNFITAKEERGGDIKCVEVDAETNGEKYAKKVEFEKCKGHKKVEYMWKADRNNVWEGNCKKIVTDGLGKTHIYGADSKYCRPLQVELQWVSNEKYDGECYEYDKLNGREYYSKKVSKKKCKPKNTMVVFVTGRAGRFGGHCFEVDQETGGERYARRILLENCKKKLIKE